LKNKLYLQTLTTAIMKLTGALEYLIKKTNQLKLFLHGKQSSVITNFNCNTQLHSSKICCDTSFHESLSTGGIRFIYKILKSEIDKF
jgi:hypothetical protein